MTASLLPLAKQQYFDAAGVPLVGGKIYTYVAGTSTPKATYQDAAATILNTNPIILDSRGECLVFWDGIYKVVVKDALDNIIYTVDNVADQAPILVNALTTSLVASSGASLVGFVQSGTGAVARNVQAKLRERVTLEDFGGVGDGSTTNQQAVFTLALNAVSTGGCIDLSPGATYLWSASTTVGKRVRVRGNGATIKFDPAYNVTGGTLEAFLITADEVEFEGVHFDATGAPSPSNNSRFIWSTANNTRVWGCWAKNLPGGTANVQVAFGSSLASSKFSVVGCTFEGCPGAAFSQGVRPLFAYNRVDSPGDVSFAFNSTNCVGGQAIGNNVYNASSVVSGHILAEEGASQWEFSNNTLFGVKNGIAIGAISIGVLTIVEGGLISNNIIDGNSLTTTNPSALISISVYYRNCRIIGNKLRGMPAGLSSNAAIVAPLLGTIIVDNTIDCTSGTSAAAAIVLTPAGDDCILQNNDINCTTGPSRHVLVNSGNNTGNKLIIIGGRFRGAAEGVNFNLNAPTNIGLWVENIIEITATAPFAVSTALPAFGDRQTYFNSFGAAQWPHCIKNKTVMYGNNVPSSGTWGTGDEVINLAPPAGNPDRWRCTNGGTPGTWKAGANLAP